MRGRRSLGGSAMRSARGSQRQGRRLLGGDPVRDARERRDGGHKGFEIGWRQAMGGIAGSDGGEQLADRDLQCSRETDQNIGTRFGLRQFDASNVLVIQSRFFGELLLRESLLQP